VISPRARWPTAVFIATELNIALATIISRDLQPCSSASYLVSLLCARVVTEATLNCITGAAAGTHRCHRQISGVVNGDILAISGVSYSATDYPTCLVECREFDSLLPRPAP
jgi:hypothetical protein